MYFHRRWTCPHLFTVSVSTRLLSTTTMWLGMDMWTFSIPRDIRLRDATHVPPGESKEKGSMSDASGASSGASAATGRPSSSNSVARGASAEPGAGRPSGFFSSRLGFSPSSVDSLSVVWGPPPALPVPLLALRFLFIPDSFLVSTASSLFSSLLAVSAWNWMIGLLSSILLVFRVFRKRKESVNRE